jgi:hypothetical protein
MRQDYRWRNRPLVRGLNALRNFPFCIGSAYNTRCRLPRQNRGWLHVFRQASLFARLGHGAAGQTHRHCSNIEIPPKICLAARTIARKAGAAIVNSGLTLPLRHRRRTGLVRWVKTSAHTELKGLEPSQLAVNGETGK